MFLEVSRTIGEVRTSDAPAARIAVISLHTSPFDQPGIGDSGGMNVEIRALAARLGARGVAVDIFTRCAGRGVPQVQPAGQQARVVQVPAGPCEGVAGPDLHTLAPVFTDAVVRLGDVMGPYDLAHSHYWLSGPAGIAAAESWDVPLVASFHTLAEVKNIALPEGDAPEPLARIAEERRTIGAADRVVAPTGQDARYLADLYGADPGRIRVVPPGVDTLRFFRRDPRRARARLDVGAGPVVLFVGRLQPLKGPDLAVRAFAEAVRAGGDSMRDAVLLVVGGPSGPRGGSVRPWLEDVAKEAGISGRVWFLPPLPHEELPWIYSAADVLLMPSRSESFGLAALEAQACGVPVVGSRVGGLRTAVRDGATGYLVEGRDPAEYAARILALFSSPGLAERFSRAALAHAARFPWESTVDGLLGVYAELVPPLATARAS